MTAILVALRTRLEALPTRRASTDRVGFLKLRLDSARTAAAGLQQAIDTFQLVRQVFPELGSERLGRSVSKAVDEAKRLLERVKDPDSIDARNVEDRFVNMKEQAQAAARSVRDLWAEQVNGKVETHRRIAAAASRAHVAGSDELVKAITRLESRTAEPPRDVLDASSIRADVNTLASSVSGLGLEGKAGAFLVSVSEGRGNAATTLDPEVRAFLDKHDLWQTLVVSFK